MKIEGITYKGPTIDDEEVLQTLPLPFTALLREMNGFIIHRGALHVRGACHNPTWHSIRNVLFGDHALYHMYPEIKESDIPFGQDCVGDQFFLRSNFVYRLSAETGEIENLEMSFEQFIITAIEKPDEILLPEALYEFEKQGNVLQPGELINVFPPYVIKAESNRSLKAISADELISFHADLSRQLENVPDGTKIRFEIKE